MAIMLYMFTSCSSDSGLSVCHNGLSSVEVGLAILGFGRCFFLHWLLVVGSGLGDRQYLVCLGQLDVL
jgi:hypothetical protein